MHPKKMELIMQINQVIVHYFEIPEIVAYYGVVHPRYTYKGIEDHKKQGEQRLQQKIKDLLDIDDAIE